MQKLFLAEPIAGINPPAVPARGRVVRSKWAHQLLTFLVVVGPGLIVMEADNDAGAVSTYIQAGAQYGTYLLWVLLFLLPCTYFIQEMVVRVHRQNPAVVETISADSLCSVSSQKGICREWIYWAPGE